MDELRWYNTRKPGEPDAGWDVCILGTTIVLVFWWVQQCRTMLASGAVSAHLSPHVAALLSLKCSAVTTMSMTTTGHICCRCRPATSSAAAVPPCQLSSISMKHLASSRSDPLSSASVTVLPSPQTKLTAKAGLIKTRSSHSTSRKKKLTNHRKETDADVYSAGWLLTSINGVVVHWGAIACSVECLFAPTTRIPGTAPGVVVIGTRSGFHLLL